MDKNKYKNPDPRCKYPFTPDPVGYCWSYANYIDGAKDFEDMSKRCPDCEYWKETTMTPGQKERTIRHLRRMIEDLKCRHEQIDYATSGFAGGYSPELKDAINLLEELEDDVADLTELEKAERKAKTTGNREDMAEYMRLRRERRVRL